MMKHIYSLRVRLVIFVMGVMMFSSAVTLLGYLYMMPLNILPRFLFSSFMEPFTLVTVSMIIATVISAWIGKLFLRPMRDLIEATHRVSQGDFSVRVPNDNDSEMGELIESFNNMAEELGGIEMFRSDFINSFSHEFKTPIVSIRGFARQLQRDDLSDEQRKEYACIIADESQRLANMASSILYLTKLEHQQIVSEKTCFRLDEQLRSCIVLLEKQWIKKSLELSLDLRDIKCTANEEMLSHAWRNLLENAIKFTPENGKITISCEYADHSVKVCISDTGIGMNQETLSHIFEKFYQGESSHSLAGNGLGLPLVKRIVELSSGSISVDSEPGRGTSFTVLLPSDAGA